MLRGPTVGIALGLVLLACAASHERAPMDAAFVERADASRADAYGADATALDASPSDAVSCAVTERCDGTDEDCDGWTDEGAVCVISGGVAQCEAGACVFEGCDATHLDCNGELSDGCETEPSSDRHACGGCGIECGLTETCTDGRCVRESIVRWAPAVYAHACVCLGSGRVLCWGRSLDSQIPGAPPDLDGVGMTEVEGLPPCADVVVGAYATIVVDHEGGLWCWGGAPNHECGPEDGVVASPRRISDIGPVSAIVSNHRTFCALVDGTAWCWGANLRRADHPMAGTWSSPRRIAGTPPLAQIDESLNGFCGLTVGGEVYCWGRELVGVPEAEYAAAGALDAAVPIETLAPIVTLTLKPLSFTTLGAGYDVNGDLETWTDGPASVFQHVGEFTDVQPTPSIDVARVCLCGIDADDYPSCLGEPSCVPREAGTPLELHPPMVRIESARHWRIQLGPRGGCLLLPAAGLARCWGQTFSRQLDGQLHDSRIDVTAVPGFD